MDNISEDWIDKLFLGVLSSGGSSLSAVDLISVGLIEEILKKVVKMEVVDAKDLKNHLGMYIVMYNSEKFVAKIEEFDEDEGTVIFTQIGGKEQGKKFKSRYDRNGVQIKVYTEEESVVALLE